MYTTTVYGGSEGIVPFTLNLGAKWTKVVGFTPPPLYPWEKSKLDQLNRKLDGPQTGLDISR